MTTSINVIHSKEMRNMINQLKNIGLVNKGIIFGGLVRDEIIGTYYRDKFLEKNTSIDNYWNPTYDIETRYRTIIPSDMDIYFKNETDTNSFIVKITEFVNRFNGTIQFKKINNKSLIDNFEYNPNNSTTFKHIKINIYIRIGRTFTYYGHKLQFEIDVITNNNIVNYDGKDIEPPFNNLDFLCNVFLMEKINGKNTIRISNCTGTPIDDMSFANKLKFSSLIIDDIIQFKTEFSRNINNSNTEYINAYRILKMINKFHRWNITNLPFKMYNNSNFPYEADTMCCVCLQNIIINKKDDCEKDDYVLIPFNNQEKNGNIMHYNCFYNYLLQEQNKKYRNPETNQIECRCPFRNPFNFKDCHKSIKYEI